LPRAEREGVWARLAPTSRKHAAVALIRTPNDSRQGLLPRRPLSVFLSLGGSPNPIFSKRRSDLVQLYRKSALFLVDYSLSPPPPKTRVSLHLCDLCAWDRLAKAVGEQRFTGNETETCTKRTLLGSRCGARRSAGSRPASRPAGQPAAKSACKARQGFTGSTRLLD